MRTFSQTALHRATGPVSVFRKGAGALTGTYLCLCLFLAPAHANVDSPAADDLKTVLELFDRADYRNACEMLQALYQNFPQDPEINYYYGRAAFEIKDYETAMRAYERVIILDPDAMHARLEMARTCFQMGSFSQAEQLCYGILAETPAPETAETARLFLKRIQDDRNRQHLSMSLSLGTTNDTNINTSPIDERMSISQLSDLPGVSDASVSDIYGYADVQLGHDVQLGNTPFKWHTSGRTYQSRYNEDSELDINYFELSSGVKHDASFGEWRLLATGNKLYQNSNPYLEAAGLGAGLLFGLGPRHYLESEFLVKHKNFEASREKDALSITAAVENELLFSGFDFKTGLAYESESADIDAHSFSRVTGKFAAGRALPFSLNAFGEYRYEFTEYRDRDEQHERKRTEHNHQLSAGIGADLFSSENTSLQIGLIYTFMKNYANIPLYEYEKNTVRGFLTLSY